jgi:glycosyltransferase involved in cell wall biosynthesis
LLGTFNGERFLEVQLDSLESQTVRHWKLYVSDDGSTDATLDIIQRYQSKWGTEKIQYRAGPQKGFAQNFLSLACDTSIKADYYAFCDQDDVWLPEKLSVAIEHIVCESSPGQLYAYGGRTTYTDEKLKPIGLSPLFVFPRTFRNALIQSIAGGNTMVFNQATKTLLEKVGLVPTPSHDWWLYQLVTGAGGVMYYDPKPHIFYRQHSAALVGGNSSLLAKLIRLCKLFDGRYQKWTDGNIQSLRQAEILLLPSSIEILSLFELMRNAKLKDRLRLLEICGLYRQTWRGTISLLIFSVLKKI